jgi:hypothetical protein
MSRAPQVRVTEEVQEERIALRTSIMETVVSGMINKSDRGR